MANKTLDILIVGAAAFAGGYLAGVLLAPRSGEETRQQIGERAKAQTRWVEQRIARLEDQIGKVEEQLRQKSGAFGDQVREAAQNAVDQVVPSLPDDPKAWGVGDDDVAGDLRHMPKK